MTCTTCGSPAAAVNGICGTCGTPAPPVYAAPQAHAEHETYPAPPAYDTPQAYAEPPPPRSPGNRLSIVAFVLAAVGVMVNPVVFGVAAIVCAGIADQRRNERLGLIALYVSVGGTLLGFALAAARALFGWS